MPVKVFVKQENKRVCNWLEKRIYETAKYFKKLLNPNPVSQFYVLTTLAIALHGSAGNTRGKTNG